jgi:hypothetical protein
VDADLFEAARALAGFDPLAALRLVALREEPAALALRGIAMAQLGEDEKARKLLDRAAKASSDPRVLAARAELLLAMRDLPRAKSALADASKRLSGHNLVFVQLQRARCSLLLGEVAGAEAILAETPLRGAPPRLRAVAALVAAEVATRSLRARHARALLVRAQVSADTPPLRREVDRALAELAAPVAQLTIARETRPIALEEVETLTGFIVDACRRQVRFGAEHVIDLVKRPVLLALAASLASGAGSRAELALSAFGAKRVTDSIRARLRVEIGRLRSVLFGFVYIDASADGFEMRPRGDVPMAALFPPAAGEESAVLALLRGGAAWSTSALAAALGTSQRAVQRALAILRENGQAEPVGAGRTARWIAPAIGDGFATTLLLLRRPADR